mmetsp:Transcript_15647/g.21456  ORF Transcript_15647/g.21456 Transcript_15647/m.21456 type:complete len:207 (-) Transcript_15647:1469-2089(-)
MESRPAAAHGLRIGQGRPGRIGDRPRQAAAGLGVGDSVAHVEVLQVIQVPLRRLGTHHTSPVLDAAQTAAAADECRQAVQEPLGLFHVDGGHGDRPGRRHQQRVQLGAALHAQDRQEHPELQVQADPRGVQVLPRRLDRRCVRGEPRVLLQHRNGRVLVAPSGGAGRRGGGEQPGGAGRGGPALTSRGPPHTLLCRPVCCRIAGPR